MHAHGSLYQNLSIINPQQPVKHDTQILCLGLILYQAFCGTHQEAGYAAQCHNSLGVLTSGQSPRGQQQGEVTLPQNGTLFCMLSKKWIKLLSSFCTLTNKVLPVTKKGKV